VSLVGDYIVDNLVSETETRVAAGNAWDILTELLRSSFWWMIVLGAVFVLASWLAGPGRQAVGARRFLAPALRARIWPYVALALVGLILLVSAPVSDVSRYLTVAALVALAALWIEVMRRQTLREYPAASAPELVDELRTRLSGWWETARRPAAAPAAAPPAAGADLTARLAALAELHASGELTEAEYAAAKSRVLAGE
jgi:hypothetical protein